MRAILDHVLIAPSVTSAILVLLHSPCVVGSDSTSAQVAEEQTRFNPLGLLRPLDPTTCAIPVDDSTAAQTGSWEPWTHPPFCVTSVSSSPGAKESHDHVGNRHKVCLFTDTRFRGGAGLSAITTPEIAASLAPKLMDPYVSWEEPKHSFRTGPIVGSADAGNETTTPPPPPYHIVPVPGRGQGVVALRRIRRAEVFMVGVPAVLVATTTPAVAMVVEGVDHQDGRQWRGLLEEAFERLPCRDALMALARSAGHGTPAEDVLRTNMFTIPVEGLAHQGLFLEISVSTWLRNCTLYSTACASAP
ncbi:hypothetical protein VTK73DRAFT_1692 [Phialemonium thermophilum]|uniref:Uncharacterized protein n=1 Tax=Phialemonium thermophilum TaxID=223376 RepID=A0ABR3VT62_9PEZI